MKRSFRLEKYKGTKSRHVCPQCGGRRCFTLYVDENGVPLDDSVGRCDHESSCGYHFTPSEYFKVHPELCGKDWRDDAPDWLAPALERRKKEKEKPLCTIPIELVRRSVRVDVLSDFTNWLTTLFDCDTVAMLIHRYRIGVTKGNDVIYFQIDLNGNCRTGKIMQYDPATGHRIKDEAVPGRISWLHTRLKRRHQLPKDWQITQCLFGEHLLRKYPDKTVALVESEKTAIICSALMPEYLWLATGGKSQFNQRLTVLKSRKIIAFPDIDGYHTWLTKSTDFPFLDLRVSDLLEKNATPADREAHIDLADWLLRYLQDTRR